MRQSTLGFGGELFGTPTAEDHKTRIETAVGRWLPPLPREEAEVVAEDSHAPPREPLADSALVESIAREGEEEGAPVDAGDRLVFSQLRYLGQAHRTYLICESPHGIVLLDQHAAHERVLYERLRAQRANGDAPKGQPLLFPITLNFSVAESALVEGAVEELAALGFEIEPFGGTTWALKAAPPGMEGIDPAQMIRELAEEIRLFGRGTGREQAEEALLARISCHSAVRAGDPMEPEEVRRLLRDLDGTPFGAQCPHGRPVAARFDLDALKVMFGRTYEGTPRSAARDRMAC